MNKQRIATGVVLAFHISGFIAIALFQSPLFISLTPINLLVCTALIFWTQEKINAPFLLFCMLAFTVGFAAEYAGVNYGYVFGEYEYGAALGPKWNGVPWMIGFQWVVILYCIGVSMHMLHKKLTNAQIQDTQATMVQKKAFLKTTRKWILFSTLIDGALLAVLFDWVMEPAAIKLGFWKWDAGIIPKSNYFSWWLISLPILAAFYYLPFNKQNIFPVHLLLIQFMFFLLINTFY